MYKYYFTDISSYDLILNLSDYSCPVITYQMVFRLLRKDIILSVILQKKTFSFQPF
jgi:hypothetical protein